MPTTAQSSLAKDLVKEKLVALPCTGYVSLFLCALDRNADSCLPLLSVLTVNKRLLTPSLRAGLLPLVTGSAPGRVLSTHGMLTSLLRCTSDCYATTSTTRPLEGKPRCGAPQNSPILVSPRNQPRQRKQKAPLRRGRRANSEPKPDLWSVKCGGSINPSGFVFFRFRVETRAPMALVGS